MVAFCVKPEGTVTRMSGESESELIIDQHVQSIVTKLFVIHNKNYLSL